MQHPTSPTGRVGGAAATARTGAAIAPRPPLSVVHARALYRAVPPVECDDDGYPFKDSARVESTRHFDARAHLVHVVRVRYAERKDVFAAADMGLYFERGNRRALVVPDGMVVFGIDNHPDLSYKLWEHLKAPDLVLEVLSKYTWRKDVYDKPALYHDLGVREYWLFDPKGRRRDGGGALEGWRRTPNGVWEAAATAGDGFVSEVLGLELLARDAELRFRELGACDVLPDAVETSRRWVQESARADQESGRADQEAARADAAQRRIAELEARLRSAERD